MLNMYFKMKKYIILSAAVIACLFAVSCNKQDVSAESAASSSGQIVFNLADSFEASVSTKATAVTAVPSSVFWAATTGTRGNAAEAKKWDVNATSAKATSGGKLATGQYQTATPTAYNYYVANNAITVPATGNVTMTVANNNTDVVAGFVAASTSTNPSITMNHVFARTGTLTMSTQSGYTISGVSWKIVGKSTVNGTAGTYNLSTGAWTAASTKLTSDTAITSSSDMYLIPGTYTIKVTYTLTKGDWSQTFTKSADVTIVGGKINNITGSASGGDASEIILNLSVAVWGTENHTPSFS